MARYKFQDNLGELVPGSSKKLVIDCHYCEFRSYACISQVVVDRGHCKCAAHAVNSGCIDVHAKLFL